MWLIIYALKISAKTHTWGVGTANEAHTLEFPTEHGQYFKDTYMANLEPKDVETCAYLCAESVWHRNVLPNSTQDPGARNNSPNSKEEERYL